MKNNYQCNFNGVRMGGGSIEHPLSIHSASIGTRWKARGMQLICTLVLLFTLGIGQMWGQEVFTFNWTSAGTAGYSYVQSGPNSGNLLTNNAIYFLSNEGPKVDASKLNPYRVGFVFKPTTNVTLKIKGSAGSSARTIQNIKIDEEIDPRFYALCKDAVGSNKTVMKYALDNASGEDKTYWASVGILKNTTTVASDAKSAAGQTAQSSLYKARVSANSISVPKNGNQEDILTTGSPAEDYEFQAGKCYRVYTEVSSSTGAQVVSFTFTATCSTSITTQPSGANLAVGDANPTLSVVATNAASYAWKESSDGTSYNGSSTLASTASFTPSVNNAAQTKYYYCEVKSSCDGTTIVKSDIVTVNVLASINYYTVTLNPAGGTIVDATGWTLNAAGNYEKEVAEGTELTLPTFTKENRNFKTWRKAGPADVASPVTVNSDLDLTAVWTATIENVIYSWEGKEGGATEVGGTAATAGESGTDNYINIAKGDYYCLQISGGTGYDKYVEITLSGEEKVKTGDKIKYWGFYYKDKSANARPKMRDGNSPNAEIFNDGTNLPNLYSGGDPAERTFTVPASINTNKVQITRSQTGSNTWIPKLQIIREVQVEEGDLLTVTFNTNGGSSISPVQVASGQTIAKPADPTKAHNRFNEWQLSGSAYNFATPVTANITLDADWTPLYAVTYSANGGSGTMTDANEYAAGEEVTLKANEFTYSGMEFVAWEVKETVSGNAVAVNNGKFTMPAAAVTVKATWEAFVPGNYVVYNGSGNDGGAVPVDAYKHAENAEVTVLGNTGSLTKTIGGVPAVFHGWNTNSDMISGAHYEAGNKFEMPDAEVNLYAVWGFAINYNLDGGTINGDYATWYVSTGTTTSISTPLPSNVTREGYTFDGWYTQNGAGNKVTSINAEYTGDFAGDWRLKAKWILSAPIGKAQSIDMEGLVESDGTSAEWQNYLYNHGYSFSTENVSLDEKKDPSENKAYDNWPYQGLKMKKSGAYVQGTVEAGKLVIIKLGHMAAAATVTIGGVAQANATGLDAAEPAGKYNYYYVASESVLRYETTNDGACVLKAITITDPYTVSFAAHGDADPAALDGHPAVTLPTPTNGTASFLGWFTAETGGTKIGDAGESYTPSADITLHAQWEAISTDARLSAIEITPNTGVLSPAFNPEETNYTYTMPYGTGAVPQITGATPNHEGASYGYLVQAENWGDVAEVRGIALSNDTKKYQITMVQGPKDGVEIISIAVKNGNGNAQTIAAEDISGFIGGTATQKLQSGGTKLGGTGNYIGFTLANSETLKAGDVIRLNVTATNGASHLTLYQDASTANLVKDIEWSATTGVNLIPVPAEAVGLSTLYIYRTSSACNPTLSNFAILRPMDPVMTAITIDGRAGEIDQMDEHHFTVTIPYEADLAALTVEPTVFWNGAHATTPGAVTSHEGAWVLQAEGDNTYRVMDKDGDYTDYTITLIRDIQKFTVSYNTHGGTAIEPELVVAGEKLAAAPADPTQEDYIFQGWSLTEDGAVIDITNVTIDEDKTFHAIWLYENPIKLIQADTINTKDFITGVTLGNVTIGSEQVECFEFVGGLSDFTNIKDKDRVVVYNATTDKTKIKVTMYNNKSSALTYYIKGVVEGSSDVVDIATVEVASGETKTSGYYEFNSDEAKNRSIYVYVETSASNMHFLQVKVIDNGETPVKKVGEIGYSLNLNKGRLFGRGSTELDFEGIHFDNSADYQPTSSTALKLANKSISFDVTDFVTMSVTTSNNKTYYVSRGAAGTDNETAVAGTTDFTLTPGKWFITAGSQNVEITNIAFAAKTPDYTRNVSVNIGTLCMEHNVLASGAVGATFYQIIGRNKDYSYKIDFEEIGPDEELKAGEPYIFQSTTGKIELYYGKTVAPQPIPVKGMIGNFEPGQLAITDENKLDILYIAQNKLWTCENLVDSYLILNDHRAYIKMSDVPEQEDEAPAPGRRRVTLGMNAEQVVTAIGNTELNEQAVKVMIDGQLFIIRGEKMFNANGQLVK